MHLLSGLPIGSGSIQVFGLSNGTLLARSNFMWYAWPVLFIHLALPWSFNWSNGHFYDKNCLVLKNMMSKMNYIIPFLSNFNVYIVSADRIIVNKKNNNQA